MHLLVDNYDSFTFNVAQALGVLGARVEVRRNDAITVNEALELPLESVIISPGPGTPADAGVSVELIRACAGRVPVLGICLGHQCIVEAFGGRIVRAEKVMHGKTSNVHHDGKTIYAGLDNPFTATRYHSLLALREELPEVLEVSASVKSGEIMGVRHREHMIEGLQFHPESILTAEGPRLLANFLKAGNPSNGGGDARRPRQTS
ncbi:MAG: aminodeoxychorismate/anthranilate synthase component II [bacterium]|nr:aminodeoxychorismate/anthranilate synthase component II [bacterium]